MIDNLSCSRVFVMFNSSHNLRDLEVLFLAERLTLFDDHQVTITALLLLIVSKELLPLTNILFGCVNAFRDRWVIF